MYTIIFYDDIGGIDHLPTGDSPAPPDLPHQARVTAELTRVATGHPWELREWCGMLVKQLLPYV